MTRNADTDTAAGDTAGLSPASDLTGPDAAQWAVPHAAGTLSDGAFFAGRHAAGPYTDGACADVQAVSRP
ncbi:MULTISPECIES: hypothetical protein [Streptomyces]|uniref:Uncharacterized protein n=1 Tax=Streptomyces yangpuensis TaxID=1648182 RepID=A0ABY5PY54_9ACTN|nr:MULTISPECIES: hypothetical protein [Streptomyces]UUY49016.1 hypothetical protein NRK68_18500 [Streptomyces yangpuensis]